MSDHYNPERNNLLFKNPDSELNNFQTLVNNNEQVEPV